MQQNISVSLSSIHPREAGGSSVAPGEASPPHILVVDDEALVRRVAREVLTRAGFIVQEVSGGEDALALLRTDARFDAVLLDVTMPGMDGIATLQHLRRLRPGLTVILTSGYCREDTAAPSGPGLHFIKKPYAAAALVRALRDAVSRAPAVAE